MWFSCREEKIKLSGCQFSHHKIVDSQEIKQGFGTDKLKLEMTRDPGDTEHEKEDKRVCVGEKANMG